MSDCVIPFNVKNGKKGADRLSASNVFLFGS